MGSGRVETARTRSQKYPHGAAAASVTIGRIEVANTPCIASGPNRTLALANAAADGCIPACRRIRTG